METENKTFEDASTAAEQLFTGTEDTSAVSTPENTPDTEGISQAEVPNPPSQPEAPAEDTLANAANVAEAAAIAAQAEAAEAARLKVELDAANARIEELSKQNEEHVVDDALTPPKLDTNALYFATAEEQAAALEKYNAEFAKYNREQIMRELAPDLEFARESRAEKERNDIISSLSSVSEFSDIASYAPQIEKILKNNSALSSSGLSAEEKIVNAYLIARGVNSLNNPPAAPKEPTTDELMAMYQSNSAFREAVEKQRLAELKNSQQVPPFSASSGAVNAALDIKEEPRTLEEASERARMLFGAK